MAIFLGAITAFADGGEEIQQAQAWSERAFRAEGKATQEPAAPNVISSGVPFSFVYGGVASADLLKDWQVKVETEKSAGGKNRRAITYTDPKTGLELRCEVTSFDDSPAVEWVLYATNKGNADTPILEKLLPLNLDLKVPEGEVILHHSHGSTSGPLDFLPVDQVVWPKEGIDLAPFGGRSSDGRMPFFNLEYSGGGVVGAIGWTGQWAFHLQRDKKEVLLQAGQQTFYMKLHPGETVRSPRILLVFWKGKDSLRGHNLLRQLLLTHYVPRINGEIAIPPTALNTWFDYNSGNRVNEENQKATIPIAARAGFEAFWVDAGWFEGGWPDGAGSWIPKPEAFPNGLKPVSDEAHRNGMKFVLWFEPERVTPNSRVAKEHPEWVLHSSAKSRAEQGDLYNLGDPAALAWITNHLSQCIGDWGIDVFRNDFNIDPLRFWQSSDPEDRQGMAENRYIVGLYAMWDELRGRHPGLTIDNCASGGRRLDLEMISRSYPLWQSDTQCCQKPQPVQDQIQNAGLSLYVPLHAGGVWAFDPYNFRSIATTGVVCPDISKDQDKLPLVRKMVEELKSLRPLTLGDYYPLAEINTSHQFWSISQFDRPDLGQGYVIAFRREQSPFPSAKVALRGLDAKADYLLTNMDTQEKKTVAGSALARECTLDIPEPASSLLLIYQKLPSLAYC
ncbi:MAG: alpha-galactosidase [Verrucomicrobiae bacterium]